MKERECEISGFHFHWCRREHPIREQYFLHAHSDYELLYFIEGRGNYLVEGHEYPVSGGCTMIMRPGEVHRFLIDDSVPYERICINFSRSFLEPLDPDGLLLEAYDRHQLGEQNRYMLVPDDDLMRFLQKTNDEPDDGRLLLSAKLFLLQCLYAILSQLEQQKSKSGNETTVVEPILRHINLHLTEELSLQQIAKQFYISPAQLNRLMKRSVGTTFWNYVIVKRLLAAQTLIRKGTPAGEAAERCGFGEYSAFYRAYKKRFGATPHNDHHLSKNEQHPD